MIRVATHQQAHRAPLVEVDHAAHDADQVLGAGLEQLIARVGLEYVDHRLAVVAGRIQPEVLDDALDLAAQHRDVARAAVVGGRGPQSQEAVLAIDTAACVEGLDADVIEKLAAVHGGGGVGLGDDQQLQLARAAAHVAAQHGGARLARVAARGAQYAQTRARIRHQAVLGAAALQAVVAVAEEYEMPALHPVEQVSRLAHFGRRQGRRVALQARDDLAHPLAHRPPVMHREAYVGEDDPEIVLQLGEL